MVLCVGYLGRTELCVWIEYHLGVGGGGSFCMVLCVGYLCGGGLSVWCFVWDIWVELSSVCG